MKKYFTSVICMFLSLACMNACKKKNATPYTMHVSVDDTDSWQTSNIIVQKDSDPANITIEVSASKLRSLDLHILNYTGGKGYFGIDPTTLFIHTPYAQAVYVVGTKSGSASNGNITINNVTSDALEGTLSIKTSIGLLTGTFTIPKP